MADIILAIRREKYKEGKIAWKKGRERSMVRPHMENKT
jgi:hypothetical protein